MMLAWSVIGLVHNGISFLFPYFSETFALSTAHNGYLTGTLAFFWTLSILVNGPLADRIGQVRLMVPGCSQPGCSTVCHAPKTCCSASTCTAAFLKGSP